MRRKRPSSGDKPSAQQSKVRKTSPGEALLPRVCSLNSAEECAAFFDDLHVKATPKLSKLERGDPLVADKWDVVRVSIKPKARDAAEKPSLESSLADTLRDAKARVGKPHAMVITRQSLRVCEIHRALSQQGLSSVKLFSKHMKVKQQVELLKKKPVHVVVGTPARLARLVESHALRLEELEFVLYDLSKDVKQFNLLTMPGVAQDVFKFVRDHLAKAPRVKHVLW